MAKRRKKKNYKLRRRVMRTIAALTMIMAIVVAAIPVENYGTMRAAVASDWEYNDTDRDSATGNITISAITENQFTTDSLTTQTLTDDLLADSVQVKAKSSNYGSEAIIVKYEGIETTLDISDKMYYNYAGFEKDKVEAWASAIQSNATKESYTVKFNVGTDTTIVPEPGTGTTGQIQIPAKLDMANPTFTPELKVSGSNISGFITSRDCNFKYDYIKSVFTKFRDFENDVIIPYNDAIQGFIDRGNRSLTAAEWAALKSDVEAFVTNNASLDTTCKQEIDDTITFASYQDFWLKSFADRVTYEVKDPMNATQVKAQVPLKGFELSERNKRDIDGNDTYVFVAHLPNNVEVSDAVKPYLDENRYLADGYVYVVGVKSNAFNRVEQQTTSTIREITLPNTIVAIGDSAFENSGLTKITLNTKVCKQIGNRAFYGCGISEINLTNDNVSGEDKGISLIEEIGKNAFYGTGLSNVTFPASITKLGQGSFAETALTNVSFNTINNKLTIDQHAFYNCTALKDIAFPQGATAGVNVDIQKAAFSIADDATNDNMKSFSFPESMTTWDSTNNDFILAGRSSLQQVKFPDNMSGKIPENTFAGCSGLASVTLGKISYNDRAGQNIQIPENLFNHVTNKSFYVEGPAVKVGSTAKSTCREQAIECIASKDTEDEFYVPYKFLDIDENIKLEKKQASEDPDNPGNEIIAIAEIQVIDEGEKTARLTKYSKFGNGSVKKVIVPSNVGGYKVRELGENCFSEIIGEMQNLIIENDTIATIGASALKGAAELAEVTIGNSVTSIGADAFADCSKLEHVYFNEPMASGDDWSNVMIIADGKDNKGGPAFKTNSKRLTFHGVIKSDYGPFKYAMDSATAGFTNTADGKNICYQSLVKLPEGMKDSDPDAQEIKENAALKVIRDNATGLSTLIDYPHLGNMGSYVADALQSSSSQLDEDQARIVNLALNIIVPEGIQSIDAKTFFNDDSKNSKNKDYVKGQIDGKDLHTLYSTDGQGNDEDCIGGLFSGYFLENGVGLITQVTRALTMLGDVAITPIDAQLELKPGAYTEYDTRGNDHLTSIVLGSTVSGMPEKYAFDSCENLIDVTLGGAVKDIGKLPFRGCISLEHVKGNGYYNCENGILYGKSNPDSGEGGFDQIVECLETRNNTIDIENDPTLKNVKSISDEAFYNCNNGLNEVDLTGSQITQIPKDCFKGASTIQKIVLPESVGSVQEGAFVTGKDPKTGKVDIWVYNQNCDIDAKALSDDMQYRMHGYEWTDNTNTKHTYIYNFAQGHDNVEWKSIEPGYTVTFKNHDGSIIKEVTGLKEGQEIVPPDMDAYLKDHPYEGHVFDTWKWTDKNGVAHLGAEAYANVKEDRDVYAQYKISNDDYDFTGEEVTVNIVGGTLNGNGTMNETKTSIKIASGKELFITADTVAGKTFRNWTVSNNFERFLNSQFDTQTTFTVPNPPKGGTITITANFINGGGQDPDTPNPDGTYNVVVNNGTGGGAYRPGATVTITATPPSVGATFVNWTTTTTGLKLTDPTATTTTFLMPASNVTVTANYTTGGTTNPTTYTVTVKNGTGGGKYAPGATVTIKANTPNTGASFVNWTTATAGVAFASATSATTTFKMPESDVTVTANFSDGTGGQPSDPNNPDNPSGTKKYKATVNYGSGSGEYEAGATVNISAYAPESSSRVFSKWTTNNSGLGFANANAASTSFVMPAADVTVTANYKVRDDDDDDDDDDRPSRRPGTSTSTNTVTNRPGSSSSTPGSTGTVNNPSSGATGTTDNNGNRIYITKNGISNTDVASLAVSGSTDNFIVRITESPEATAAVEQSLTNTYGTLQGLAYLPMDISLYDSTGQNKITDTHGLNITVTMPIPDVLIQYGGNARVAAADNGGLQQLTPRFTTIDGIACISFVPPHFSPYVIYVDTNNLIAGQMLDATPATGDPIHPKWFAAIGMACISILLFVASDGRRRKNYRAA